MKKHYLHENKKIIKLIILISTMISAFSVYLDIFVLHNSLLLTLGDCALFVILLVVHCNYELFLTNEKLRQFVVALLPLVYFPLAWLGSTGNSQIGVLYFFLFSSVMIFINPTKVGFMSILLLLGEMMLLLAGGHLWIEGTRATSPQNDWVFLLHLAIAGVGNTFILYNIIVRNHLLTKTYYHDSNKDFLTGSYNRRYLDDYFASPTGAKVGQDDCYLLFCDLDDFKIVNDRYGHEAGDNILKLFGDVITNQTRSHDLVGRYGGDEFVIVAYDITEPDVIKLKARIQDNFSNQARQLFDIQAAVSIGYAKAGSSLKTTLNQADAAMYQDKKMKEAPGL